MDQSNKNPNLFPVIPKWSELCPDLLLCFFERLSFTNMDLAKSFCRSCNKNPNRLPVIPKWSELCPDLLQCVFERLSFTNFNRAKSVCRSWNSASRSCVPKRNQIPCLILFPKKEETNSNSCALFVPDDKDNVYMTRDLGAELRQSYCLATHGSWLLMFNEHFLSLYILKPLTLERIDLTLFPENSKPYLKSTLWIDDITKDYLVVCNMDGYLVFTKKGHVTWQYLSNILMGQYDQFAYSHKDHRVYTYVGNGQVDVWDFSGDIPRQDGYFVPFNTSPLGRRMIPWFNFSYYERAHIATTVSGQVLYVQYIKEESKWNSKWRFHIYKPDLLTNKWVEIDSLGNEALILDMGFTVIANDIPGIKRNSIYLSGHGYAGDDPDHTFVYDLTTRTVEYLPECVFSSIRFSHARWFFPDFTP